MNLAYTTLTAIQVLLAIVFAVVGMGKLAQPYDRLTARMAWVKDFKPNAVRLIGGLEALAAVGIVAPLFVPSLAQLAGAAAVGLALVMAGAMATHLRRGELLMLVGNLVLLGFALFVAYGRLVGFAA